VRRTCICPSRPEAARAKALQLRAQKTAARTEATQVRTEEPAEAPVEEPKESVEYVKRSRSKPKKKRVIGTKESC